MSTFDYTGSATYSPDDNKLRIYPYSRLDTETYAKVKAAGYAWAPKQECFYATWTPCREDLAELLCGDIEDDDKTLTDRAEQRAERFQDYKDKRAADSEAAFNASSAIAERFSNGQPILIGHHSEKRARKDQERMHNAMKKSVKMWETSEYWADRAAGALRHAKYKELPAVRARRIKTIEAEKRKQERYKTEAERNLKLWTSVDSIERARQVANVANLYIKTPGGDDYGTSAYSLLESDETRYAHIPSMPFEQVREHALKLYPRCIARYDRWIAHFDNRLAYEKAMLDEQGASDLLVPVKQVQLKTTKPLCNYKADTITYANKWSRGDTITVEQIEMTSAEYARIHTDYKGTVLVDNSHRVRIGMKAGKYYAVYLTDSKVHAKPEAEQAPEPKLPEPRVFSSSPSKPAEPIPAHVETAKAIVKNPTTIEVVSAPQFYPTPEALAEQVVELAEIEPGMTVLEPSAGTGRLMAAAKSLGASVTGIEIDSQLFNHLMADGFDVCHADFLTCPADTCSFDRVVMNPPFAKGDEARHILHAYKFLKPGGVLVSIASAGVAFRADGPYRDLSALIASVGQIEPLPAGSFVESGTGVNTVLVTLRKPSQEATRAA